MVETAGTVTVNGAAGREPAGAVAGAQAGDSVAARRRDLSAVGHAARGRRRQRAGAGAGRTTIDATGLAVGVSFAATDPKSPAGLDRTTVTGAATCVARRRGATGSALTHLVVRDCATAGIAVAAGGGAAIVNATVVGTVGVDSSGRRRSRTAS